MNNKLIHIAQVGTKLQSIGKLIIKNETITSEIIQTIPDQVIRLMLQN